MSNTSETGTGITGAAGSWFVSSRGFKGQFSILPNHSKTSIIFVLSLIHRFPFPELLLALVAASVTSDATNPTIRRNTHLRIPLTHRDVTMLHASSASRQSDLPPASLPPLTASQLHAICASLCAFAPSDHIYTSSLSPSPRGKGGLPL